MSQDRANASNAYRTLCDGGVVLLPTDVGYGLVACTEPAIARIYELKGRPRSKPCVTVANAAILDDVAVLPDQRARAWLDGIRTRTPIAVVNPVRRQSMLLERLSPYARVQATSHGTIATFLNAGALVSAIAELALADGRLVLGSSANLAFAGNNYTLDEVPDSIQRGVDLVIPGGPVRYQNPGRLATTVLDMTSGEFIRAGIEHAMIEASWRASRAAA